MQWSDDAVVEMDSVLASKPFDNAFEQGWWESVPEVMRDAEFVRLVRQYQTASKALKRYLKAQGVYEGVG